MLGLDLNIKIAYAYLVLRGQYIGKYIWLFCYMLGEQLCRVLEGGLWELLGVTWAAPCVVHGCTGPREDSDMQDLP